MSYVIQQYKDAKAHHEAAKKWVGLIGLVGHGDEAGYLHTLEVGKMEIYYQAYGGARNYHVAPLDFHEFFSKAIREKFQEIAARALELQAANVRERAALAAEEYAALMREAGAR